MSLDSSSALLSLFDLVCRRRQRQLACEQDDSMLPDSPTYDDLCVEGQARGLAARLADGPLLGRLRKLNPFTFAGHRWDGGHRAHVAPP